MSLLPLGTTVKELRSADKGSHTLQFHLLLGKLQVTIDAAVPCCVEHSHQHACKQFNDLRDSYPMIRKLKQYAN